MGTFNEDNNNELGNTRVHRPTIWFRGHHVHKKYGLKHHGI